MADPAGRKMAESVERLRAAKIGNPKRWKAMAKKLRDGRDLNPEDLEYYSNITRIYGETGVRPRSRRYHTKLSELDPKPPCRECGDDSAYYCNMNDQYFCAAHLVGHDENEI